LKHLKKNEEELKIEWRPDAEKRAKLQLVLNKIADVEKIVPEKEKIERDVENLKNMYKDASEERIRTYVETVLTNEKVFEFLESQQ